MKSLEEYNYTVLFEPAEEGGYIVKCPALSRLGDRRVTRWRKRE